jgi:hypothetical protein
LNLALTHDLFARYDSFLAFRRDRPNNDPRTLWSFGGHSEMRQPFFRCRPSEGDEEQVVLVLRTDGLKANFSEPVILRHKLTLRKVPHRGGDVRPLEQLIKPASQLAAGSERDVREIFRVERVSGQIANSEREK